MGEICHRRLDNVFCFQNKPDVGNDVNAGPLLNFYFEGTGSAGVANLVGEASSSRSVAHSSSCFFSGGGKIHVPASGVCVRARARVPVWVCRCFNIYLYVCMRVCVVVARGYDFAKVLFCARASINQRARASPRSLLFRCGVGGEGGWGGLD